MKINLIIKSLNLPALYSQENEKDPIVRCKLFTPCSSWTWWLTEYDPATERAFGYAENSAHPDGAEWGYTDIKELAALRTHGGMPAVERDRWFRPQRFSEAVAEKRASAA